MLIERLHLQLGLLQALHAAGQLVRLLCGEFPGLQPSLAGRVDFPLLLFERPLLPEDLAVLLLEEVGLLLQHVLLLQETPLLVAADPGNRRVDDQQLQ